jgi:glycosyltransferase 2 family protein
LRKTKIIGFLLTFVFLGLVLWKTDLSELWSALRSANYLYVIPAAFCTATSYLLRTARWQRILLPTRRIPYRGLLAVLMIGFMANNILPARLGEVVRAYVLGRREAISKSLSFATIMLERLLDGVTLLAVLGVLALMMPLPVWGEELAYVAGAVFLIATLGIVVLLLREDLAGRVIHLVLRPLPRSLAAKAAEKADSFILGLHALRGGRAVFELIALSVVIWSVEATFYYLVLTAFNIALPTPTLVLAALLLLVVVNLGIMLPSAPGYVGTFQFFGVLALGVFGVQRELALSATIVAHGVQYVLVTAVGLLYFGRENISLRTLTSGLQAAEPAAEPVSGQMKVV